jgi:very-short-patch-repair endonuclease
MLRAVRELGERKDTIEGGTDGLPSPGDANLGPQADKSDQPSEDSPRFGRSDPNSGQDRPHLVPVLGQRALLSVSGHRDARIAAIARVQRGLVSRRQLLAAGIESGAIVRMLANGSLWPAHQGVYSVGCSTSPPFARETAALLAVGPSAVLSHQSAAFAWGVFRAPTDGQVHVLIDANQRCRKPDIVVHRTNRLERREIRISQRLPVTSPARTLRDIAGEVTMRELERALDEALVRRIVRLQQLRDAVARDKGRAGGPLLATLLDHRGNSTITRSQAEERMLEIIRAANFPMPECNPRVNGYEVDFLWRPQRVIVEIDGYAYHCNHSAFERDRAKGAALGAAGFVVIRVTWLQMEHETLIVVANLAQALARGSP